MVLLHTSEDSWKHQIESCVCARFQASNKVEVNSIGVAPSPWYSEASMAALPSPSLPFI